MIRGENKVLQAFVASLITWALTTIGATIVFFVSRIRLSQKKNILRFSLGFASGVMLAASFWSLLAPGLDMATKSGWYGTNGEYAWLTTVTGFPLGAGFVLMCDKFLLPRFVNEELSFALTMTIKNNKHNKENKSMIISQPIQTVEVPDACEITPADPIDDEEEEVENERKKYSTWRHMMVLVVAVIVHNIPEGLALGVAFGAIGTTPRNTFASARNQAIGIGLQNIAEGLGVSVPLWAAGYSPFRCFCYGAISGATEPIFSVVGALAVKVGVALLPYTLSFAAGSVVYAVVDALLPEAYATGHARIGSWGCVLGFLVMMVLDLGAKGIIR